MNCASKFSVAAAKAQGGYEKFKVPQKRRKEHETKRKQKQMQKNKQIN